MRDVLVAVKIAEEAKMGRGLLLWLIGIPIPIILLIWLFGACTAEARVNGFSEPAVLGRPALRFASTANER